MEISSYPSQARCRAARLFHYGTFGLVIGLARAIETASNGEHAEASGQNQASWRVEGFWDQKYETPTIGQGLKDGLLVGRQGLEPCPPD